jgi:hypothetical protein
MASETEVKQYLAQWFQLGKRVLLRNGAEAILPKPIFRGNHYSVEFETCWQQIISPESGDCYLEGTEQTIKQLLAPAWEIASCARCTMPVPLNQGGLPVEGCPCFELSTWPNLELPLPREPVDATKYLKAIQKRLNKNS